MSLNIYLKDSTTNDYVDLSSVSLCTDLNVTHNLNKLAMKLGCYEVLWRPQELPQYSGISYITCESILPLLYKAYYSVSEFGEDYPELLPTNGWGTVLSLLDFIKDYIKVAELYSSSYIVVST